MVPLNVTRVEKRIDGTQEDVPKRRKESRRSYPEVIASALSFELVAPPVSFPNAGE